MTDSDDCLLDDMVRGVLPSVTPYQFAVYAFLVSIAQSTNDVVTIGKRRIAAGLGKGTRSSSGNLQHISQKLTELHELGLIRLGASDRSGTQIEVIQPTRVPWVRQALNLDVTPHRPRDDYFRQPELRAELFKRDDWRCRYCGTLVDDASATLDHILPRSRGGADTSENLATACHGCNSIKSGLTEAEAAPLLLNRLATIARRS